jgi:hypothetical protein
MINGESSSNGLTVSHMRSGSWIITDEEIAMAENEFAPVTPGEMLREDFWLNTGFHKISWPERLEFRQTGSRRL